MADQQIPLIMEEITDPAELAEARAAHPEEKGSILIRYIPRKKVAADRDGPSPNSSDPVDPRDAAPANP